MKNFKTILKSESSEIVEKKSKFISYIHYVENEEMIEKILKEYKKKYYDSRHICYAWRIMKDGQIAEKSNDDGEPSGTAGAPMLNILKKNNLCNVLVLVIRYFGGILLGTGGLVRAYSEATQKTIEKCELKIMIYGIEMELKIDYQNLEFFKYYCKNNNINVINIQYMEDVMIKLQMEEHVKEKMIEEIVAKTLKIKEYRILDKKYIEKNVEKYT